MLHYFRRFTMKSTILLGTTIVMCFMVLASAQQENIKKYDQVSIESVLGNDRVLTNYIKCLLDKGACTKEGRELKRKCDKKCNLKDSNSKNHTKQHIYSYFKLQCHE